MTAVVVVNAVLSAPLLLVIVGGLSQAIAAPRAERHPRATAPAAARGLADRSRAALKHAMESLSTQRQIGRAPMEVQATHDRARTWAHRRALVSRRVADRKR
jgi:hypothetical protein